MTTLYARTGGGNWGTATTWSLTSGGGATGSVPTAADDVILDANSGNVTINGTSGSPSLCRSLTCTGYTGTLTHGNTQTLAVGDGTTGHFVLVAGMTYAPSTTSILRFLSTTTGNQITTAGKNMGPTTFDGVGGGWQFQDAFSQAANTNNHITLTNGALDFNNQDVTTPNFISDNSNTRSLTFGTTNITIGATSTAGVFNIATSTNMTMSAASGTITFPQTSGTATMQGGGLTYGTITSTAITTGEVILGGFTCSTLTLSNGANQSSTYSFNGNVTVSGTFTANGNSSLNRPIYRSSVRGTQRTITAATVTSQNSDWQDIVGAGAASWDLSAITGLSGDCGGNSGLTLTTPVTNYWVPASGTSTGNFNAVTRWANASGGTAGTGRIPLPQDTCAIDANSIDAGSRTLTQGLNRIGAIDFTGATNTPTFTTSTAASFFGSITLISGMTLTGSTQAYTFEGRGSSTITCATKSWAKSFIIDCANGTLTQGDAFTTTDDLTFTSGTFNNSTFNTACSFVTVTNGTVVFGSGGLTASGQFSYLTSTAGSCTFNGASTIGSFFTLNMGAGAGGHLYVNADITCAGSPSFQKGNMTITNATISGPSFSYSGAGSGGGSGSFTFA